MKDYGSKIIGVVTYAQANGSGTDIKTVGYGGVENVAVAIATVATDLGLVAGLHAGSTSIDVAVSPDSIAVVEASTGSKTKITFAGGTSVIVNEDFATVKAALGL